VKISKSLNCLRSLLSQRGDRHFCKTFIFNIHFPGGTMLSGQAADPIRQQALTVLMAQLIEQGIPVEYAKHMATATIFQADLELRNAQVVRLLDWLRQDHSEIYQGALSIIEETREEFERRIHA
jgi:hypothetical protein